MIMHQSWQRQFIKLQNRKAFFISFWLNARWFYEKLRTMQNKNLSLIQIENNNWKFLSIKVREWKAPSEERDNPFQMSQLNELNSTEISREGWE